MPSPLSPVSPIAAAANLARGAIDQTRGAISQVTESLGFDKILQGDFLGGDAAAAGTAAVSGLEVDPTLAKADFALSVRQTLADLGLPLNPSPELRVRGGGRVTVENNVDQAARIEAAIEGDPGLQKKARELLQNLNTGEAQVSLADLGDLTPRPPTDTIHPSAGGYANWLAD